MSDCFRSLAAGACANRTLDHAGHSDRWSANLPRIRRVTGRQVARGWQSRNRAGLARFEGERPQLRGGRDEIDLHERTVGRVRQLGEKRRGRRNQRSVCSAFSVASERAFS